jgi:hypothetical protein
MAVDKLQLQVLLNLSDRLSGPLGRIKGGAQGLNGSLDKTAETLRNLQRQQAAVGRAQDLQKSLTETAAKLDIAKTKQSSWAAAVKAGGNAAKLARPEMKKASEEVDRLTGSHRRLMEQAKNLRRQLTNSGIGKLAQDETSLAKAIDLTTKALERQKGVHERLAAAEERMMVRQKIALERQRAAQERAENASRIGSRMTSFGYGMRYGGARVLGGLGHMLEPSRHGQIEEARIRALGMDPKETQDAIDYAKRMRVRGASEVDNIGLMGDAMSAFADTGHAKMVLGTLAKMKVANATLFPDSGGERDQQLQDMLKVVELRGGLNSHEEFARQADMVQQVINASRGRVQAHEWRSVIGRGGVAAKSMDAQAFFYELEPLVQDMTGNAVGRGMMSAYQNLYQGKTTKRAVKLLENLNLIGDYSKVEQDKAGQIAHISPGAIKGAELFAKNQIKWVEEVLLPTLKEKGITDQQQIKDVIGGIFTDRSASAFISQIYLQLDNIHRAAARNANAKGIDATHADSMKTPGGAELELAAARADLYKNIGDAVGPTYVWLLEKITSVVKWMAQFSKDHPTLVKSIAIIAAVFAGLSVAAGALLIPLGMLLMNALAMRVVFALAGSPLLKLGGALKWLGGGAKWLGGALQQVLALAARFGPRLLALSGGALKGLGGALQWVRPHLLTFGRALLWLGRVFLTNPLGLAVTALAIAAYMIYKHWDEIKAAWREGVQRAVEGCKKLAAGIKELWQDLRNWPSKMFSAGKEIGAGLADGLASAAGLIKKNGAQLLPGMWQGIKNDLPKVGQQISALGDRISSDFSKRMEIKSPSRVFMRFGGHISEGLALGIERSRQLTSRAALALAASAAVAAPAGMAAGITPAAAGLARPQASAPRSLGGSTYNITINAAPGQDPQAIAQAVRLELDRRERAQRGRVLSQLSDME